jgi:hypothetical protein
MREGFAKVSHTAPNDETADGAGHKGHRYTCKKGTLKEGLKEDGVHGRSMLVIMVVMMRFVVMIMVMGVGSDHAGGRGAEELGEFRVLLHALRSAFTADMAIQTDDMIAFGHDHMQVMAHHENAAAMAFANAGNQFIEFHFTEEIDGLHRLIENQQIRLAQQGPRQ